MVLLFDAANTLIHKPDLFIRFKEVLEKNNYNIELSQLKRVHQLVSEVIIFPDKTSKAFYLQFNKEVLYCLGVVPTKNLLDELFKACSYLPWKKFDDSDIISSYSNTKAVLSNFHGGLNDILSTHFPNMFSSISISESLGLRKPDTAFYEHAIEQLNVKPSEILYIGDSVKLDLEPALKVGMNAYLIDRNNAYSSCNRRINSFSDIKDLL